MESVFEDLQPIEIIVSNLIIFIPKLIVALIIFFISLYVSKWGYNLVQRALERREADTQVTLLLSRAAQVTIIVFGTIWALSAVDFDVTGFVAGLGIVGLTVGFALKDVAENFVAGILLLVQRPFEIGQAVEAGGHSGIVENIEIRSTTLRTFDGLVVIVPNSQVFSSAITNFSKAVQRRISIKVGVNYGANLDKADALMVEVAKALPGIKNEPAPFVVFEEFGDSSINATLYFWIDMAEADYFNSIDSVIKGIKRTFAREGIDIPFPTRTVYIERDARAQEPSKNGGEPARAAAS